MLGLTPLGDAAATLTRSGAVITAAEEKRSSRQKHHLGFPFEAVTYRLNDRAGRSFMILFDNK